MKKTEFIIFCFTKTNYKIIYKIIHKDKDII